MASRSSSGQGLPGWVLPVVIIVGVLIVGFVGWKAFTGSSSAAPGAPVETHPGMYNFQQEMQKGGGNRQPSPLGDALH